MSGYDPVSIRMRPTLARLHRDTFKGKPSTLAYATLCTKENVPNELRPRLLRMLVHEGYVTEESLGQVRLTEAGTTLVTTSSPTNPRIA
jgi:hypothetical protein